MMLTYYRFFVHALHFKFGLSCCCRYFETFITNGQYLCNFMSIRPDPRATTSSNRDVERDPGLKGKCTRFFPRLWHVLLRLWALLYRGALLPIVSSVSMFLGPGKYPAFHVCFDSFDLTTYFLLRLES
jgi:hypothetical protein